MGQGKTADRIIKMGNKKAEFGVKQTSINMITQVISFVVNMLIGFFLTPYIVENIQSGNGFITLSSNFISYATLITTAVNSMAGRFIAVSYYKKDTENVLKYYSSVFFANVFLCFVLTVPLVLFLAFMPSLIDVPENLVGDVRTLFILVFSHFFVDLIFSTFTSSGYVVNRLDMVAMKKTEATVLKGVLTFAIFSMFLPKLWYVGVVQLLCSFYNAFRNYRIHKTLMPEIKISRKHFDIHKVAELVSSGIWNTISSVGSILVNSLDVLIVNVAINAEAMDIVSVAKYIPIYVQSIIVTLSNVFAPKQTKHFAENDFESMKKTLLSSSRIVAFITCIPVVFMAVYGKNFFQLWIPSKDAHVLWILSLVAVAPYPIQLVASAYNSIISSANKVKINSLVTIGFSVLSLAAMFILLKFIDDTLIKMCVIVGCSMAFLALQSLVFIVPYSTRIIHCKPLKFYFVFVQSIVCVGASTILCYLVSKLFIANSWLKLIASGIITCIISAIVGFIIILGKSEKTKFIKFIKTKLLKKKENN